MRSSSRRKVAEKNKHFIEFACYLKCEALSSVGRVQELFRKLNRTWNETLHCQWQSKGTFQVVSITVVMFVIWTNSEDI